MRDKARRGLLVPVLALLAVLAATQVLAEEPKETDEVDWGAKAIQRWNRNCRNCHATPDVRFETDRAFLSQIPETT